MLVKAIIVFLLVMLIVAMVGKALFPSAMDRMLPRRKAAMLCGKCGRPQIGRGPCDCGRKAR